MTVLPASPTRASRASTASPATAPQRNDRASISNRRRSSHAANGGCSDYGIDAIRYWLGTTRYGHNEVVFDGDVGSDIIGTRFTNREHEARMEVQHQAFSSPSASFAVQSAYTGASKRLARFRVSTSRSMALSIRRRARRCVAAFLFEELQLTRALKLQAAARIESTESKGTGIDLGDPVDPSRRSSRGGRSRQRAPASVSSTSFRSVSSRA